jgi:hypothetical protein
VIFNTAEYRTAKYNGDQFLNIVKGQESNKANMNSTIQTAAKVVKYSNQ